MIPLKVLLASALLVPAGAKVDRNNCAKNKPFNTKINIHLEIPDAKYNHKISVKKLTTDQEKLMAEWKNENEDHVWASQELFVYGLARGGMGVRTNSKFLGRAYDRYGMYYCPFVKEINIDVFYHTQIFVASELKKGTCQFDLTLDHELWHHETNVKAVEDTLIKLKKELPQIIAYMERRYVPRTEMEKGFNSLSEGLSDAIEIYGEHMYKEIQKRNAPIDSPENYERESGLCDPQNPKKMVAHDQLRKLPEKFLNPKIKTQPVPSQATATPEPPPAEKPAEKPVEQAPAQ
jgi:hypothetical protein